MKRTLVSQTAPIARINIIPIIGVALVLVLILLVTAPMLSVVDMGITLPPADTRGSEDEDRINITLGKDGELAIDDVVITNGTFALLLEHRLTDRERGDPLVVIRADADTPHEAVRGLLQDAREVGALRLAIATQQGGVSEL